VDFERHPQSQHPKESVVPKLMLAGSIEASGAGQCVTIEFENNRVLVRVSGLRSAWKLRKTNFVGLRSLLVFLAESGISVDGQVASRKPAELFPEPGRLVRLFLPPAFGQRKSAGLNLPRDMDQADRSA